MSDVPLFLKLRSKSDTGELQGSNLGLFHLTTDTREEGKRQVPKAVVEAVQVDCDIFVEHDNMFYVSAAKLHRILSTAIFQNLNSLNS